jgi:hypothetical protein
MYYLNMNYYYSLKLYVIYIYFGGYILEKSNNIYQILKFHCINFIL